MVSGLLAEGYLPEVVAFLALCLALLAEVLHARRSRRLAHLAFGPGGRPAFWARGAGFLRAASIGAVAWGLSVLLLLEPRGFDSAGTDLSNEGDYEHVMLVLDVSPSMRLVDAGPSGEQSRMQRARDLVDSFFARVPLERYRVSVVAFYNGAKPVVIDTADLEVVRNILGDLPMHYAWKSGQTRLFDGLEAAAEIAKPWNPGSTTLLVISDGDTVPASGMPRLPASIKSTLIIGVGDSRVGKFIDGRQSRQDVPTLRQVAARLQGTFHNGNDKHLASTLIAGAVGAGEESAFERLTRREYALIAAFLGALMLALLPLCLHHFGSGWRPGTSPGGALRWLPRRAASLHTPARALSVGSTRRAPARTP